MASLLDEIMRRKQEGKPVMELPDLSRTAQESYMFILLGKEMSSDFFDRHLCHEAGQCESLINTIKNLGELASQLQCYYFKTDSLSIGTVDAIIYCYINPGLKNAGYIQNEELFMADTS